MLKSIRLRNVLSFGPESPEIELRPLNILIGPNGVGKSNLIDAISVLQALPRDMSEPLRLGGGARQWLHKLSGNGQHAGAEINVVTLETKDLPKRLHHRIVFGEGRVLDEIVERDLAETEFLGLAGYVESPYYDSAGGRRPKLANDQSILVELRDSIAYPEITFLAMQYSRIHFYREWSFGRRSTLRVPSRADERGSFLREDMGNLGNVLNQLRRDFHVKKRILAALEHLYPAIEDFDVSISGGSVEVFLHEGGIEIPASRLSDGTLRFLCLLAVLCHPTPPPLVCIEEPELGLHPDMMPQIADLLREASERCQLIVTTHSAALIDCFSREPECVLVCEKRKGSTTMERLDGNHLAAWLKDYSLGKLWEMGEIGGNRW